MSEGEGFLSRWSRLKREAGQPTTDAATAAPATAEPVRPLPELESLDFSSDFTAFLQDKVEESVKRAALKKLFHSPEFNVMDGLDVYIDDYGASDPIPAEMLRKLAHAKEMLFGPDPHREDESSQDSGSANGVSAAPAEPQVESPAPDEAAPS